MPDLGYMTLCACVCLYLYTLMSMGSMACPCAMTLYVPVSTFMCVVSVSGDSSLVWVILWKLRERFFSPKNFLIPVTLNLWPRPKGKHSTLGLAP